MTVEILHRYTRVALYSTDAQSVREATEAAVRAGACLDGAYLAGANLDGANLRGAYLDGAYLRGANLDGAYLDGANLAGACLAGAYLDGACLDGAYLDGAYLGGANLAGANLRGANLDGANLAGACLAGAYLAGANLDGACLDGAYLGGANLDGANLRGAYLDGACLDGAYLDGANLRGAYLGGANLDGACLDGIRDDFFAVLDGARAEVPGLYMALLDGRVDGSTYQGECLVGTIANVRGCNVMALERDASRPAERWFAGIRRGDTPENNVVSGVTRKWIEEYAEREGIALPVRRVTWEARPTGAGAHASPAPADTAKEDGNG